MTAAAPPAAGDPHREDPLDAGEFGAWLQATAGALAGRTPAQVPCGDCSACCSASQFVPIEPDEADTLAHVPAALRFPAPGGGGHGPPGTVLLPYDEHGRCPMLVHGRCSIYAHRPRACRTYDCRVFAAAGVPADEGDATKAGVAARARRWRFTYGDDGARSQHREVRSVALRLRAESAGSSSGPTGLALRAVREVAER